MEIVQTNKEASRRRNGQRKTKDRNKYERRIGDKEGKKVRKREANKYTEE
jgi:hypothetical protein